MERGWEGKGGWEGRGRGVSLESKRPSLTLRLRLDGGLRRGEEARMPKETNTGKGEGSWESSLGW